MWFGLAAWAVVLAAMLRRGVAVAKGTHGVSPWRWAVVEIPVTDKPAAAARMLVVRDRRPVTALGVKAPRHRRSGHRLVGEHHR